MKEKKEINYAERLDNQLDGMFFNPKYQLVREILIELMRNKHIYTRHITKDQDFYPFNDNPLPLPTEDFFVGFKDYNSLMVSARLLTLIGTLPKDVSSYNLSFLSGVPTEAVPFTADDYIVINNDPGLDAVYSIEDENYSLYWLMIGENQELRMAAMITTDEGVVMPLPDYPIRSDYVDMEENRRLVNRLVPYEGDEDGYEYISELFDYLYDPDEDYLWGKEYQGYLMNFDDEEDDEDYDDDEDYEDDEEEEEMNGTETGRK